MLKNIGSKDVDPIEGKETEFTLVKALGHGNFGNVFIVTRRADQVDYALKQVDLPDDCRQKLFIDEAGSMRRLSHRNIVNLKDFWLRSTGGLRGYLLMELCESDLGEMLKQAKSLSIVSRDKQNPFLEKNDSGEVILEDYLIQGLTALEFMQHSGVVHSDIKPANLFIKVEKDEEVLKIGDFGMAKFILGSKQLATSLAGGTEAYQPPEAKQPNFKPGPSTDVYSFAVSMWQLATLDTPDPSIRVELPVGYASADTVAAINEMLKLDPARRPSAGDILRRFVVRVCTRVILCPLCYRCPLPPGPQPLAPLLSFLFAYAAFSLSLRKIYGSL